MSDDEAYNLIPDDVELPEIGEPEDVDLKEREVPIKLFTPSSAFTWYVVEYDPESRIAFGYTYNANDPRSSEWGYFDIKELKGLEMRMGDVEIPAVERDVYWQRRKVGEIDKIET